MANNNYLQDILSPLVPIENRYRRFLDIHEMMWEHREWTDFIESMLEIVGNLDKVDPRLYESERQIVASK